MVSDSESEEQEKQIRSEQIPYWRPQMMASEVQTTRVGVWCLSVVIAPVRWSMWHSAAALTVENQGRARSILVHVLVRLNYILGVAEYRIVGTLSNLWS